MNTRLAATLSIALGATAFAYACYSVIANFPVALFVALLVVSAAYSAWYGLLRRGAERVEGLVLTGLLLLSCALFVILEGGAVDAVVITALAAGSMAAAKAAVRVHVDLPDAEPPRHAVLFYNPKSGGSKAERFHLDEEARSRGIEPLELKPGVDLWDLVRGAVADGADALAMAGGDGSQAIVAAVAAEHGLPYACIPAGTRNHFALDLGVDRDDVVGALDALVDGRERRVDLAEVNGRTFVNNVSLGLYAEAVQRAGYREAKMRTIIDTLPEALGPKGHGPDLQWQAPSGHQHTSAAAILVSNNRYRLGRAVGSGTRPRIDDGLLGITVAAGPKDRERGGPQRPWREWSAPEFEVDAKGPVPIGVDGEAVVLEPPLHFRIRPGALRVRIARAHPGASPSHNLPEGVGAGLHFLIRRAAGREPAAAATN